MPDTGELLLSPQKRAYDPHSLRVPRVRMTSGAGARHIGTVAHVRPLAGGRAVPEGPLLHRRPKPLHLRVVVVVKVELPLLL